MKIKGRKRSVNIIDRREKWKDGVSTFIMDSFSSASKFKPQEYNKFKKDK